MIQKIIAMMAINRQVDVGENFVYAIHVLHDDVPQDLEEEEITVKGFWRKKLNLVEKLLTKQQAKDLALLQEKVRFYWKTLSPSSIDFMFVCP